MASAGDLRQDRTHESFRRLNPMTLATIAARLRRMADRIEALPSAAEELDLTDETVPKFV